jgi:hypothetical protein
VGESAIETTRRLGVYMRVGLSLIVTVSERRVKSVIISVALDYKYNPALALLIYQPTLNTPLVT